MSNPNALAALITTILAEALVYLAHKWGYAKFSTGQAIGAAGGAVTVVLFLGRQVWQLGIRGIAVAVWRGSKKTAATAVNGVATPPEAAS